MYMCMQVCVYTYIYIYILYSPARSDPGPGALKPCSCG